jgi:CheY-like chemotaxis protein
LRRVNAAANTGGEGVLGSEAAGPTSEGECPLRGVAFVANLGADQALRGLRVLVVEDEVLIAMYLEDILLELGCEVIGPASTVSEALDLAARSKLDAATLDVNLGKETVYPVAEALEQARIPFVFVTGYGAAGLSETYARYPAIKKPVDMGSFGDQLLAGLRLSASRYRAQALGPG